MVDTKMAENYLCIYWEEHFSERSQYVLMNKSYTSKCSSLPDTNISKDERYTRKIKYQRRNLYDENDISYKLLRLPQFSSYYLEGELSLFSRGYIHWSDQCLFDETTSKKETWTILNSNFNSMRNWFWLILFFFLFLTIVNCVGLFVFSKSPLLRYRQVIFGKLVLLFNYLAFVIILKSMKIQGELKDFMDNFNMNKCSDEITNYILKESFRLFNKVEGLQNFVFFIWKYFIYLVMCFSFLIFMPLIYRMILIKIKLVAI